MRSAFHDKLDGLTVLLGDMCGLAGEAMARRRRRCCKPISFSQNKSSPAMSN